MFAVRASVTVVTAKAAVTLDPRGLNPIVFDIVGTGDAAVLVFNKPVADATAADDLAAFGLSKPASDGATAQDAVVQDLALPKTETLSATDQIQPWSLAKAVDEAVYIDDFATRSVNGNYADQATTDDFSEPVDDLGWDITRTGIDDPVTPADQPALGFLMGTIADALSAPTDASQILVGKNPVDAATASDALTGYVLAYNNLADGGNYFTPDYNTERYGIGELMSDLAAKATSKSGIADSITLANTGGLVMTDYVDTRWFLDNYTGTYRALS